MRSHEARPLGVTIAILLVATMSISVRADQEAAPQPASPTVADRFSREDIDRAIAKVKADPNLATERTIKSLRWKSSDTPQKPSPTPAWVQWIGGLFRWFEQSARILVWCAAIVLAGMLAVFIVRLLRSASAEGSERVFIAPTHVRDLDIRPESLPSDIGGAARALWDRGKHRASLALLYRGLLSRLAHVHQVPIRDSSTEGDCLLLAASHLTQARCEFAARLVRAWQRFVYGREEVPTAIVHGLCDEFASALNAARPIDSQPGAAA